MHGFQGEPARACVCGGRRVTLVWVFVFTFPCCAVDAKAWIKTSRG
jgi:hypothetical protein